MPKCTLNSEFSSFKQVIEMMQFVRGFGNSTTPAIHGSTYGSMPKREDAFTGYRTVKERFCQDYSSARRGLPFQNAICGGLDEYGCDDRSSGGKHNGGLIRNALLEEICFDYPPLYLFEMECHSPAAETTRIPDYLSDIDQIIPFGMIGEVEEMLTQQRENKHASNGVICGSQKPNNAVISTRETHREKGRNSQLMYTNLDEFSQSGSKAYDLNVAVASPTISSSCEPEMVLSSSGLPQSGIDLNEDFAIHSSNNSAGVQSELLEESRGRDQGPNLLHRGSRTSDSNACMLYSGHLHAQTGPAPPPPYRGATSLVLPPSTCAIDTCSRERDKPRCLQHMRKLDNSNDDSLEGILYSTSVSSAAKLEEALPSELINVKGDGLVSTYGVLEQPKIPAEGEESNATSTSTSPSQIHAAKKQRIISCASDLLEDLKDSYAFTQGANPFAPAVHPTFTDPMIKGEMQRPYCFQPPRDGVFQTSVVSEQPVNFNFGATSSEFQGTCSVPQFQHETLSGINRSLLGDEYCNYNWVRPNNVMTPSSCGDTWFNNGRQLTRSSPGVHQSCPDLSSPEDTSGNLNPYSSAQINDSYCYGRPFHSQLGFNSNGVVRQDQPMMAYYDEDDYLLSPISRLRQHASSAPNTPSKHGPSGQFPFQETAHLQRLPSDHHSMSFQSITPVHRSLSFQRTTPQILLHNRNTDMNYFDPVHYPSVQFASEMDPISRIDSPFCNTPPRMHRQPFRSTPLQKQFDVLDSSYNHQSADASNVHQNVPLTQQRLMQRLIHEDSNAFKSHPLFPLLRDIIIADTNFHSPKFPFPLVAHLPTDFGRLLHNYVTRNPGINLDQGDAAVHSVFMEGLKFAHSTLISKIKERNLKEGCLDCDLPLANIKDICDSFNRCVKPEVSYGADSLNSRGLMAGDGCLMPEYPCMPSVNGVESGTGSETSRQRSLKLPDYSSSSSSYASVGCSYQVSSSASFGLNTMQNVYPEGGRGTPGSLSSSPKKPSKQSYFVGEKDRNNHGTENAGERTGKNKVLPRESVSIMLDWLREHQENPYPNDDEKESLIASTRLNITQINYWFTNARRRILPKWALQRHVDEQEKAQEAGAATCIDNRPNNSPTS